MEPAVLILSQNALPRLVISIANFIVPVLMGSIFLPYYFFDTKYFLPLSYNAHQTPFICPSIADWNVAAIILQYKWKIVGYEGSM